MKTIGAIILAAGKGTRMKSKEQNKVTLQLGQKPMILYGIELLESLSVHPIVVVVGFAKESVMKVLRDRVIYAVQRKRLGTGHAALCGLRALPEDVDHVLIMQGDDSALYTKATMQALIEKHISTNAQLTFLTIEVANPFGLGRVVRNAQGEVTEIVEEKDASDEQRQINEINPACYIFTVPFLRKYINKIQKSKVTGEFYLTHLIDIALAHGEKVETLRGGRIPWRGVNTPDELHEAEKLLLQAQS